MCACVCVCVCVCVFVFHQHTLSQSPRSPSFSASHKISATHKISASHNISIVQVSHLDTFLLLLVFIQCQADGYIKTDDNIKTDGNIKTGGNIKANGMTLLADNWSDLTTMLDALSTSCKKLGLAISCKKTKSIAVLPPESPNV